MDSNTEDEFEMEEQFIMRLPLEDAEKVRKILRTKPNKLKKYLKIDLNINQSIGKVHVGKNVLTGYLQKFPTIIESYKTNISNDKSNLYKTADISHVLQCYRTPLDCFSKDLNHGYTAPLKNVKTKRFRKTLNNPEVAEQVELVAKELHYLLKTDYQATTTRFELIDEKKMEKDLKMKKLFGDISSDSETECTK